MKRAFLAGWGLLCLLLTAAPATAQSILPAADGTATLVTPNGQRYDITGGTLSGDGANLFHSFEQFGLSSGEMANFLAQPGILNILGRVVGGNASIIDGLIQVSGGNANLYLMNPAGIVFGPNASLNLPAAFTATTADSIGFGSHSFNALGANNYQTLTGTPNTFTFLSPQPGAIVNAGHLSVNDGDLSLLGGTMINTGSLAAPNGTLTVAAVPGENRLRISQSGMLLSLEIDPIAPGQIVLDQLDKIAPQSLPALLTSPQLQQATGIIVDGNGQVRLNGSGVTIENGSLTFSGSISGGSVNLAAAERVRPVGDPLALVRTGDGSDSAPTVTHFAQSLADPNAYIFLDTSIPDYLSLLYSGKAGTTTVAVTPQESGIDKVTALLTLVAGIDELHLVSEGDAGSFWLGNDYITAETIEQYRSQFQSWNQSLNPGADILIYACLTALGDSGSALLNAVAEITGADVAGSTTLTGSAARGGDWTLEQSVGSIEAAAPFQSDALAAYDGLLQVFTASTVGELISHITTANSNGQSDTIRLTPNTTFTLTAIADLIDGENGLPSIDSDGFNSLTIDGFGSIVERDPGAINFRLFNIRLNADLRLNNLTLRNGRATAANPGNRGGAIFSRGALTVTNSTISGNLANDNGGGIFIDDMAARTTVTDSTISGNGAVNEGGGIANGDAPLTVTNSTISGNTAGTDGGGIHNDDAQLIVTNSTISGNTAGTDGGGIVNEDGQLTVNNSTISGNVANADGGGIRSRGENTDPGTTIVNNSTISGNIAGANGGGISNYGQNGTGAVTLYFNNSTISGNIAGGSGGGLFNYGDNGAGAAIATLNNSTISNNSATSSGSGIFNQGNAVNAANVTAANSIIAGNATASGPEVDLNVAANASFTDPGNNLIGSDGTGAFTTSALVGTVANPLDPQLFPLGNYGGSTQTHLPRPTSAAINAGNNSLASSGTDQRGVSRFVAGTVDIGAVESHGFSLQSVGSTALTVSSPLPATVDVSVRTVENAFQQPVPLENVSVGFSVLDSTVSGFFTNGTTVLTDAQGIATNFFTLNSAAANFQILATSSLGNVAFDLDIPAAIATSDVAESALPAIDLSLLVPLREQLGSLFIGAIPEFELDALPEQEGSFTVEFETYWSLASSPIKTLTAARAALNDIEQATGIRPALIYGICVPQGDFGAIAGDETPANSPAPSAPENKTLWQFIDRGGAVPPSPDAVPAPIRPDSRLQLVLVTAKGEVVRKQVPVTCEEVQRVAQQFTSDVTDRRFLGSRRYLKSAQQLYQWLVAPLEAALQERQIENLVYVLEPGLRSLPLAALHDGQGFLVERYSVGLMPTLSLTDTRYTNVKNMQVLAMGATEFSSGSAQMPLPAVAAELASIAGQIWQGQSFLNRDFTLPRFQQVRQLKPFGILHLATHADFRAGKPENSYIQFWNERLPLDQMRERLSLYDPPVELMVLSACRTAVGDPEAELGFAGLAVQAGVKTAMGSLWVVSDEGTMGLMTSFYEELRQAPIKAEALRQAQLSMLRGEVRIQGDNLVTRQGLFPLPPNLSGLGNIGFSHPYFWSGFTMIGNPW